MAGLMDYNGGGSYMGPRLTPEELKALQKAQQGGSVIRSVSGEYIPKSQAIGKAPAGLLEGPTVSTQQQSRTNPNVKGRTFYTNSAGQTGTSVPKGSGMSGVYDDVAKAASKGGNMLGTVGKVLASAPLLGAQLMLTPGELESGELTPEQQAQLTPEDAAAAAKYAQGIQDKSKIPPTGKALLSQGVQQPAKPSPQQKAAIAQDTEKKRQVIEAGAKEQLKTSQLSRAKAAEAVVKADFERQGIDATPEQKKKAVAIEAESIRKMDNDSLAKYLSYAIIGVGFLAGGSSQAAGQAWSSGFRQGYADTINRAAAERKLLLEQAQLKVENAREERKLNLSELDTTSKVGKRTADIQNAGILTGLQKEDINSKVKDREADNLTDREKLALEREKNALYGERTKAQIKKLEADTKKAEKSEGVNMGQKDQFNMAEMELKARGLNADEGVVGQYAAEKRRIREQLPDATEDEISDLAYENLAVEAVDPSWPQSWFTDKKTVKFKGAKKE